MVWPPRRGVWLVIGVTVFFVVILVFQFWNYWSWHPKVFGARVLIDNTVSERSVLYFDLRRQHAVIALQGANGIETYYVNTDVDGGRGFVWQCEGFGFSFLPGLAFSNHLQFGQRCFGPNLRVVDVEGEVTEPKQKPVTSVKLVPGIIEFTTGDSKRVSVSY